MASTSTPERGDPDTESVTVPEIVADTGRAKLMFDVVAPAVTETWVTVWLTYGSSKESAVIL